MRKAAAVQHLRVVPYVHVSYRLRVATVAGRGAGAGRDWAGAAEWFGAIIQYEGVRYEYGTRTSRKEVRTNTPDWRIPYEYEYEYE